MDSYGTINGVEHDHNVNPADNLLKSDPPEGPRNQSNGFISVTGSMHRRISANFYRAPEEENEEEHEEEDEEDTEEEDQQRVLSESPSIRNQLQISDINNENPSIQDNPDRQIPKQAITGDEDDDDEEDEAQKRNQKRKSLSCLGSEPVTATKKPKKKNNVWTKSTSRKGKKKSKSNANAAEETVFITPVPRFPDKNDDSRDMKVCLSKVYKAEKVELSDDRLTAGSCKGYRMVRATRGVVEGAWYVEIKTVKLGESAHTRLGWSTEKGDLQAPVGYDGNSFAYRDLEGSKVHKALRERYGEPYYEGDVIGCYINLPEGALYAPKPPQLVWYKGQRYACAADWKEEPPKVIPGSQISFFKNGVCQGVAFKDLNGGRYYPAASMYTLPNKPSCVVRFNFGPDFDFFPMDFGDRPIPKPMSEAPYHGYDNKVEEKAETPAPNGYSAEKPE